VKTMNCKKNFNTVLVLLLAAAAGVLLFGVFIKDGTLRRILFQLAGGLGLGALIQCVLFAVNPGLFKDKRRPS
jgi:cytochrome c biogenesis factor